MKPTLTVVGTNRQHDFPHDIDIEQQILGAVMRMPALLDHIAFLESWHFSVPEHSNIWDVILELKKAGSAPDMVVMAKRTPDWMKFGELDALEYFKRLVLDGWVTCDPEYIKTRANRVRYLAEGRSFLKAALKMTDDITQGGDEKKAVEEALAETELVRNGLFNDPTRITAQPLGKITAKTLENLKDLWAKQRAGVAADVPGAVYTGIRTIDNVIGGFFPGELIYISARPGNLKTTMACALMSGIARIFVDRKIRRGVGMIHLEMKNDQLGLRLLTNAAYTYGLKVSYNGLRRGAGVNHLDMPEALVKLDRAQADLDALPIVYDVRERLRVGDMDSAISTLNAKLFKEYGVILGALALDQFGFVEASDRYSGQQVQEYGEISKEAKRAAGKWDLPFFVLHQQVRPTKGEDPRPKLSGLRGSGDLEQDADIALLLHWEASYMQEKMKDKRDPSLEAQFLAHAHELDVQLAKFRMGPQSRFQLFVDAGAAVVQDMPDERNPPDNTVPAPIGPTHDPDDLSIDEERAFTNERY